MIKMKLIALYEIIQVENQFIIFAIILTNIFVFRRRSTDMKDVCHSRIFNVGPNLDRGEDKGKLFRKHLSHKLFDV